MNRNNACEKISTKFVKEPSILPCLISDYIRGMSNEAMHGIFEGVTKKLPHFWLNSTFNQHAFLFGPVLKDIDI